MFDDEGKEKFLALRNEWEAEHGPDSYDEFAKTDAFKELVRGPHRTWKLHPVNGEPLYPRNETEFYDLERTFYQYSEGNGNVVTIDYRPPTAEEIRVAEREDRIAEMQRKMAEVFVDSDTDPAVLLQALAEGRAVVDITDDERSAIMEGSPRYPEPGVEYPAKLGRERYRLSNGDQFEGILLHAVEAEAAVKEARERAGATPEF